MSDVPTGLVRVFDDAGHPIYVYTDRYGGTAEVWPDNDGTVAFCTEEPEDDTVAAHFSADALEWLANQARLRMEGPSLGSTCVTALVTLDKKGRLSDSSTVTVGEDTWDIPLATTDGPRYPLARIAAALRAHGWRQVEAAKRSVDKPEVLSILVERIDREQSRSARMTSLRNAGFTVAEIAEELGLAKSTVYKSLRGLS